MVGFREEAYDRLLGHGSGKGSVPARAAAIGTIRGRGSHGGCEMRVGGGLVRAVGYERPGRAAVRCCGLDVVPPERSAGGHVQGVCFAAIEAETAALDVVLTD